MKSKNLFLLEAFFIFLICARFIHSVKIQNKPELLTNSAAKKNGTEATVKVTNNNNKNVLERVKSLATEKTKLTSKSKIKQDNLTSADASVITNTTSTTTNSNNQESNTNSTVNIDTDSSNSTSTNETIIDNNSNNNTSTNDTIPADDKSTADVYYLPKIGGISINNPLPDTLTICAKCDNSNNNQQKGTFGSRPSDEITFPGKENLKFQSVQYVKDLSPGGKAAIELEEMNDPEYKKIVNAGYESPTFNTKIVEKYPTAISKPANINFNWQSINSLDSKIWQDVEYARYNNRLLDTSRFNTPAQFTSVDGTNIIHAPSDSGMQIISPAKTTISTMSQQFLDLEEENYLFPEVDEAELASEDFDIDKYLEKNQKKNYSFLK